jgi:hypothetical protein
MKYQMSGQTVKNNKIIMSAWRIKYFLYNEGNKNESRKCCRTSRIFCTDRISTRKNIRKNQNIQILYRKPKSESITKIN